jgi:hypothetical protein
MNEVETWLDSRYPESHYSKEQRIAARQGYLAGCAEIPPLKLLLSEMVPTIESMRDSCAHKGDLKNAEFWVKKLRRIHAALAQTPQPPEKKEE